MTGLRHDRILTTHAGSLPRPQALSRLHARKSRGEAIDAGELEVVGRAAIRDVLAKQIAVGIDCPNDGEQTRDSFVLYVRDRMTGLGGSWQRKQRADAMRYPIFMEQSAQLARKDDAVDDIRGLPKAIGPIGYPDDEAIRAEAGAFREALTESGTTFAQAFMTAPSPGMISAVILNEYYPTREAYFAALAEALRVEYEAIVAAGFMLQLDCPDLAREKHNTFQDRPIEEFLDFGNAVVDAINAALRNIPAEQVRMHVCWGNYEGPHDCDVDLETIIPVIGRAKVGGYMLPFANPRHAHEYRHLKELLGKDRTIIAGVIDTTTNYVEHPEVVAERLERVAAVVGDPGRVMAGTDCGFETFAGRGRVAADVVWAKMQSLNDGARIATKRLF
jgi:5-methyltetrahydropteroyltriglutamate--homocysteine methyltransferase